jgi:hypothetical protein
MILETSIEFWFIFKLKTNNIFLWLQYGVARVVFIKLYITDLLSQETDFVFL